MEIPLWKSCEASLEVLFASRLYNRTYNLQKHAIFPNMKEKLDIAWQGKGLTQSILTETKTVSSALTTH